MSELSNFSVTDIEGQSQSLAQYAGQVLLVVNVASRCGFTGQYQGLQTLYEELGPKGFVVLGFPCNQFGGQEPQSEKEIQSFCDTRFGVTFPMFAKVDVNGEGANPFYIWLKSQAPGLLGTEAIKWNFTKFLVDRHGKVLKRYAPNVSPEAMRPDIKKTL
jgi:glutathione peroxidase